MYLAVDGRAAGLIDAPALAKTQVGIAMGTGTEAAMESAGVTLVKSDLRGIARARRLCHATIDLAGGESLVSSPPLFPGKARTAQTPATMIRAPTGIFLGSAAPNPNLHPPKALPVMTSGELLPAACRTLGSVARESGIEAHAWSRAEADSRVDNANASH